jgi:mono/diheme cytochrome c family protein
MPLLGVMDDRWWSPLRKGKSGLILAFGALLGAWPAFAGMDEGLQAYQDGDYPAAFRQLQPLADTGGPYLQELLAVMHRFGLGTPEDAEASRLMLERAARQPDGSHPNYRSLQGAGRFPTRSRPPDVPQSLNDASRTLARVDSRRIEQGRHVFLLYCAGCHGFNGFAAYPPAPSFSMRERLHKSDAALMWTILKGRNTMPSWESKLPRDQLEAALDYIRHLAMSERMGATRPRNSPPPYFFKFWPDEM